MTPRSYFMGVGCGILAVALLLGQIHAYDSIPASQIDEDLTFEGVEAFQAPHHLAKRQVVPNEYDSEDLAEGSGDLVRKTYRTSIVLKDDYRPSLSDVHGLDFQNFKVDLIQKLTPAFRNVDGTVDVHLTGVQAYQPQGQKVQIDLTYTGVGEQDDRIKDALRDFITSSDALNALPGSLVFDQVRASVDCGSQKFKCGNRCLDAVLLCDGKLDCLHGEDEAADLCAEPTPPCLSNEFQCDDGTCIEFYRRCDLIQDCKNNEDEENCPCDPPLYQCNSGMCVEGSFRCDGVRDCDDGSDEDIGCPDVDCEASGAGDDCGSDDVSTRTGTISIDYSTTEKPTTKADRTCGVGDFRCDDGTCVSIDLKCNFKFDCPDQSDERDCSCRDSEWMCQDGSCIDGKARCDKVYQCADMSDEAHCDSHDCPNNEWRCVSGECIAKKSRCDGFRDCIDQSDENDCQDHTCREDQFRCNDGICIPAYLQCDGQVYCRDHSDEDGCPHPTAPVNVTNSPACASDQFMCSTGVCISASNKCDGTVHCQDRSDEINCPSCFEEEFTCHNTKQCIHQAKVCDGKKDCEDFSDERNCTRGCLIDQFECEDGRCLSMQQRCDGRIDCVDAEDEAQCCEFHKFRCSTGHCIDEVLRCNGYIDCPFDYSDEDGCTTCRNNEFTCKNNLCVASDKKCDGFDDCFDGSDESDCHSRPCSDEEFKCLTSDVCIDKNWKCDGVPDCVDASDEFECQCKATFFDCGAGVCIPESMRCDGTADCVDGSDENDCRICEDYEFSCANGQCVDLVNKCNGVADCQDASDETRCEECPPEEFHCGGNLCIPQSLKCNGYPDCPDNSDEKDCRCTGNQLPCGDGTCFHGSKVCDGMIDCLNGMDESNCPNPNPDLASVPPFPGVVQPSRPPKPSPPAGPIGAPPHPCPPDSYRCSDGQCIDHFLKCDGQYDCRDYTDEKDCSRNECEFRCDTGECIRMSEKCDGTYHCPDASDEYDCTRSGSSVFDSATCGSYEFQCKSGECVSEGTICDGRNDCLDRSDEENCTGGTDRKRCDAREFTCGDGTCISLFAECDGYFDCRDGSDEANCQRGCTDDEYTCDNGQCISMNVVCDGRNDCLDNSDEKDCRSQRTCTINEFTCRNGECVPGNNRCDRKYDCSDQTDEYNCPAPPARTTPRPCEPYQEFMCNTGTCIALSGHCDGKYDCPDGSDESHCDSVPPTCNIRDFRCDSGQCIPVDYFCDGRYDCIDRSDETRCNRVEPEVTLPERRACSAFEFACRSGDCVPRDRHCNGAYDCIDRSDEENCPGDFTCDNGQVIRESLRCDRRPDCSDGSDETRCQVVPEGPSSTVNLQVSPIEQSIEQTRQVVFRCRDTSDLRKPVRWVRQGSRPLPPGSTDIRGRLTINDVRMENGGAYFCEAQGVPANMAGRRKAVTLTVIPFPPTPPPSKPVCGVREATCLSGECVPRSAICDGDVDCSDGSDEIRCDPLGCEPNEFQCDNRQCVQKSWICDSDDDCGDQSDEKDCGEKPEDSICRNDEFTCKVGKQCIPKAFHCDNELDCHDSSDEFGCNKPIIVQPPPRTIVVEINASFNITCKAVGVPMPIVVWRLNWGHVPPNCNMTSTNGFGTLSCYGAQPSSQGAYSCEALNSLGSVFAEPDAILYVNSTEAVCRETQFNAAAVAERDCLDCFCFGVTQECFSSEMHVSQVPPPDGTSFKIIGANQGLFNGNFVVRDTDYPLSSSYLHVVQNTGVLQLDVRDRSRLGGPSDLLIYFSLPDSHKGPKLHSYGGNLRYTINFRHSGIGQQPEGPDVIIRGNNVTLMHVHDGELRPDTNNTISVRFWHGQWYKKVVSKGGKIRLHEPANRRDIMMVLENMDLFLVRGSYTEGNFFVTTLRDVQLDTGVFRETGQGRAIYVEECRCPPGYTGISCQHCAFNYRRVKEGPYMGTCVFDVVCGPNEYGDPSRGIPCLSCPCPLTLDINRFSQLCYLDSDGNVTCNCLSGYQGRQCQYCAPGYEGNPLIPGTSCRPAGICDPAGSYSPQPDPTTGLCQCLEYATGPKCNQCQPGSFYLNEENSYGCIKCFCMGKSDSCTSANWYRTQEIVRFVADSRNFQLVDQEQSKTINTNLFVDKKRQELIYSNFAVLEPGVYYWTLPRQFLGDKVTSYGGNLTFTLRYVPTQGGQISKNNAYDVEIFGNDITMRYYGNNLQLTPNDKMTISVPFYEHHWQRQDGGEANREHFLMALADLEHIFVKATYTTSTQEVGLYEVRMDFAEPRNTGQERAFAVEMCECPVGYIGLSCEDCGVGYTRKLISLNLGNCVPCECNGHSRECDPEQGICFNCRDNRAGDFCETCAPGYSEDSYGRCSRVDMCTCDIRGSLSDRCFNDQCRCKANTEGDECNLCKEGHFHLSEENKDGCLNCWCSGVTTKCSSSHFRREQIPMSVFPNHGFTLTDRNRVMVLSDLEINEAANQLSFTNFTNSIRPGEVYYWSLANLFTGNRLSSYGGQINVTQKFSSEKNLGFFKAPDVIFVTTDRKEFIWMNPSKINSREEKTFTIDITESNFSVNQAPASRGEFLTALASIEAILIRATFSDEMQSTSLKYLTMDTAGNFKSNQALALEVEQCSCPREYTGLSCESCVQGYYRDYLSNRCLKCPCSGKEDSCHSSPDGTVICSCLRGFSGTNCEISGVLIELRPLRVIFHAVELHKYVDFSCGYQASHPLGKITFSVDGEQIASTDEQTLSAYYLYPGNYTNKMFLSKQIHLTRNDKYVRCNVYGVDGVLVGSMASKIEMKSTQRPGPDEPLEVSIDQDLYSLDFGRNVQFKCSSTSYDSNRISFIWDREGASLPYGRASDNRQGTLVITQVRPSDSGVYICRGSTGLQVAEDRTTLHVSGGAPPSKPVVAIDERREEIQIQKGETVRILCRGSGNPPPQLLWIRQDGRQISRWSTQDNGVLSLTNTLPSDTGIYICRGRNSEGFAEATITIYVEDYLPPTQPTPFDNFYIVKISEEEVNIRPGGTIRITCRVKTTVTTISYIWSRVQNILPQQATQRNGELMIPDAQPIDSGLYTCKVSDDQRRHGESTSRIIVEERGNLPEVRVEPDRQTIYQGTNAELRCIATGDPLPTVTWQKVNEDFTRSVRIDGHILRVENAMVSDRGLYSCTAVNSVGKSRTAAILEVERREPPVIEMYPDTKQTIERGSSALFQCHLTGGIPSPVLTWSRTDGRQLSTRTETLNGGVIKFNQVTEEEEGAYICTAVNDAGRMTAVATLEIQALPVVTITPSNPQLRVQLGERVVLVCDAHGDPIPSVVWQKLQETYAASAPRDPSAELSRSSFEINRATYQDQGTYQCTASSSAGKGVKRIQLIVEDQLPSYNGLTTPAPLRPEPPTDGNLYRINIGEPFEFICDDSNDIDPTFDDFLYQFRGPNGAPLPDPFTQQERTIRLNVVSKAIEGEYACIITKRITGEVIITKYFTIEVTEPPRITLEPVRQVVRPGENVNIRCTVTGSQPITVTWQKDAGQLPPSVASNGGLLMFRNIEQHDAGRYRCLAVSPYGSAVSLAEVVINEGPMLTALQPVVELTEGQDGELKCRASGINELAVRWHRDHVPMPRNFYPSGNVLRITSPKPEDSGRYECRAEITRNDYRSDYIDLIVKRGQPVRIFSVPETVRLGDDVELYCDVEGSPQALVSWSKLRERFPFNAIAKGPRLRLEKLRPSNGGVYICSVTTEYGSFEKQYVLTMQNNHPVTFGHGQRSVKTRTAQLGSTVVLRCQVELLLPMSHTWNKQGNQLPLRARVKDDTLEIPKVQAEDAGTFICTGRSDNDTQDVSTLLIVTGVVPRFSGSSYLALPTLQEAYLTFDIEVSFKPENSEGLILYNSQKEGPGDYISFGLKDGFAEFRFELGSGAAVLQSEERLGLGEWHTATLSRNRKEGTMSIDGGRMITGRSTGRFQGLDLINPLYVGGVPDLRMIEEDTALTAGFEGCVSRLVIGSAVTQLMGDSRSQHEVTPCNTCSDDPCENGGVCQEAHSPMGHKCICPAGFSGDACESTGQSCYPGVCNSGRCVNRPEGFDCYCPFGYTGYRCQHEIAIQEPSFGSSSYLAYPTPKAVKRFSLGLKIKPETLEDGLIMYCSQHDRGDGDFASLTLRNKRLEFMFNTGTGSALLQSEELAPGTWTKVHANRTDQVGSLSIDDGRMQQAESPGTSKGLNLRTPLFVGGVDTSKVAVNPDVKITRGFTGCISEIEVMDQPVSLSGSLLDSANVGQCGVSPCKRDPCENGATCTDDYDSPHRYICTCPPNFRGPRCEMSEGVCARDQPCLNGGACEDLSMDGFLCLCPLGFSGLHCEHEFDLIESASFNDRSWIEVDRYLLPQDGISEQEVKLDFTTYAPEGLIFWHGQDPSTPGRDKDYISLGLKNGYLDFTFHMGGELVNVTSPRRVNDGTRHTVIFRRDKNIGTLIVDALPPTRKIGSDTLFSFHTLGNIYIGGTPDLRRMTGGSYSNGFVGCVHRLDIGSHSLDNLMLHVLRGVNVAPCPR